MRQGQQGTVIIDACVLPVDVFDKGMWTTLKDLDDPELLRLARKLPSTVLQSRAISSSRKYTGAFRRWKQWAKDHKLPVFTACGTLSPVH